MTDVPIILELAPDTWMIAFYGKTSAYALLGTEKGLLIDPNDACTPFAVNRLFGGSPFETVTTEDGGFKRSIELGNRTVACVPAPGVTENGCFYFDDVTGIAFTGSLIGREIRPALAVSEELSSLLRLRRCAPARLYPSVLHAPDYRALQLETLENAVGACRAALHPSASHYREQEDPGTAVYGDVVLHFDPAHKWEPGEHMTPYPIGL